MKPQNQAIIAVLIALTVLALIGWVTGIQDTVPVPPLPVALAQTTGDCIELYRNGVLLFADGCEVTPEPATVTPVPATPTETSTPAPSDTPPATFTAVPTLTPTPTATATQEPTGTPPAPTVTPDPLVHDTTAWHPPGDGHHHGADPMAAHPAIVEWMLQGHPEYVAIGGEHVTSETENVFPFPLGKHEGFVNFAENDTNCDRFDPGGMFPNDRCILAYYLQVHTLGTAGAFRTRVHSWRGVFYVCDSPDGNQCGIVAGRGHVDFGLQHSSYKRATCESLNNPPYPLKYRAEEQGLPPYVSTNGSDRGTMFWSSITNAVIEPFFDPVPNQLLEMAFSERVWSSPNVDPALCPNPDHDLVFCPDGSCGQNQTRFQVFTLLLDIADYPRPYAGFVNNQGTDAPDCIEEGPGCYRLYIEATVPGGNATLNRQVHHGDPAAAPILDYDDGTPLHMPGYQP